MSSVLLEQLIREVPSLRSRVEDLETAEIMLSQGTWTASMTCTTSGTISLAGNNTGAYTKIGRMVTVTGRFEVDGVNSPVGEARLNGLPFTCADGDQFYAGCSIYAQVLNSSAVTQMMAFVRKNTSHIAIYRFAAGTAAAAAGDFKAGSSFIISATYFTT